MSTNPFANSTAIADGTTGAAIEAAAAAAEEKAAKADAAAPADFGIGDPFADPTGVGDGARITEFVDRLLLVKPTEVIEEMNTAQGKARDVVRADLAVLDDPTEPGKIVEGVLLFQMALKREAKGVYESPSPYLIGRLSKGKTNGGNTLYTFQAATDDEKNLARQFLAVKKL